MDGKEATSLRNEKLKAKFCSSETEEQRKERLRIRCEKDRARRRLRNTKPRLELCLPHNVSTFYPSIYLLLLLGLTLSFKHPSFIAAMHFHSLLILFSDDPDPFDWLNGPGQLPDCSLAVLDKWQLIINS